MTGVAELRVVSWDLDGTLYDMGAMRRALNRQALGWIGRSPWRGSKELFDFLRLARAMEASRGDSSRVEAFIRSERGQRFLRLQAKWIVTALGVCGPRADAATVMDAIHKLALRQVVFSDYPIGEKLTALGLEAWVDHRVVAADTYVVKPDPRSFARLYNEMDVAPCEVLHIGDRVDTDGGAAAAGSQTLILGRDIECLSDVLVHLDGP
jgi:FMN phosphatase YigB (HAD superfamily)